jgi:hypothetical protein
VRNVRGSEGRRRKTGRYARGHHGNREKLPAPKQERHDTQSEGGDDSDWQYRLVIGGEVKGDAGSKGDGNPW